ncbi:unnamed protein product [Litomosoides sigmodontis]|uniref:Ribosome biogenesis protein NOP53 n=1 Tax=Litomosoides sigmodontis TaxID=42156 RepID=A0A3P6TS58_LITSI|nr:unnamed protein product [Litomosoides sigmodontis]
MSDNAKQSGKVRKCRISRNKKRYWKKGVQIQDVEDFLCEIQADELFYRILFISCVKNQNDDSLFTIDKKPDHSNLKLTRRQRAAMTKRLKKTELVCICNGYGCTIIRFLDRPMEHKENVSKRKLKKKLPEKSKKPVTAKSDPLESPAIQTRKPYDLWGQQPQREVSAAEEYYLLTTKKKPPQEPKTMKHISSILLHVEVAPAGASYNPPVSKYLDYVTQVAEEEKRKIKESGKLRREFALLKEKYATQEEIELELRRGLNDSDDNDDEMLEDSNEIEQNHLANKRPIIKRKTKKMRRREYVQRKQEGIRNVSALRKEQMHLIYSARKLNKEISTEMQRQEEFSIKRKEHKLMKKFAGTQRLGRGKFKPYEQPVLLTEELAGSLRELKPQGSILTERLKSLQKRNILSISGEKRHRRKLKNKLRFKERESRKHQEVKLGTRLI